MHAWRACRARDDVVAVVADGGKNVQRSGGQSGGATRPRRECALAHRIVTQCRLPASATIVHGRAIVHTPREPERRIAPLKLAREPSVLRVLSLVDGPWPPAVLILKVALESSHLTLQQHPLVAQIANGDGRVLTLPGRWGGGGASHELVAVHRRPAQFPSEQTARHPFRTRGSTPNKQQSCADRNNEGGRLTRP